MYAQVSWRVVSVVLLHNHRLDPPHSGVTALAQNRKRRATGRAGQAERSTDKR